MELRMYKYRMYPSIKQKDRLFKTFIICKEIYNEILELSIKTYKETGKTPSEFDYNTLLVGMHKEVFSQVKQNVSDRVAKAFKNFFRRVKDPTCKGKGFPRFKSKIHSITYPQKGFKFVSDRKLHLSKIGNVPIVLHRVPKGRLKTLTVKRNKVGQWFAIFACEVEVKPVKHQSKEQIGIDIGLENFATISNGMTIENPKHLIKTEERLKRLQRQLSRKTKGSANRRKAKFRLAKQHIKVANQRSDFLHKLSRNIADKYSFIAVENLNIKGMIHNHYLAKHISDASWNEFIRYLEYKAVTSGSRLVKVNPRNTSKTCSKCGAIADMPLEKRQFNCANCGFVCHRDLNASINILKVGQGLPEPNARGHGVRPSDGKAVVDETGTIRDKS
jgi:putative transposase